MGFYMRTCQQKWEPASKNENLLWVISVLIFAGGFPFLLAVGGHQFLPFALSMALIETKIIWINSQHFEFIIICSGSEAQLLALKMAKAWT